MRSPVIIFASSMFQPKLNVALLIAFILFFSSTLFAQEKKDTIYYDEDFSICEQPVAEYYRVCVLNRNENVFYKGNVEDHYLDGRIRMTGDYASDGIKNGEFVFYNDKGVIIKKGNFLNNEMLGDWYYYDSSGHLKAHFFCRSSVDFTPITLIDNNNDTLLKNGTGDFRLDLSKDQPYIISTLGATILEGHVNGGVKEGELKYYIYSPQKQLLYKENYQDGRFVKGRYVNPILDIGWMSKPVYMFTLLDINLTKIDLLNHSNMAFGPGAAGLQQALNYLQYNIPPQIQAIGEPSFANDNICFNIISKVVFNNLNNDTIKRVVSRLSDINFKQTYFTREFSAKEINKVRQIEGGITLEVDSVGKVASCFFDINLTPSEKNKLTYYLHRVTNLAVAENDGKKVNRQLNLRLNTILDTLRNNMLVARYVLYNADSVQQADIMDNETPQLEPKFAKGPDGWLEFLEKNLNPMVAADHNAPIGDYVVNVSFMVDELGNISDVKAENNPGYGTAKEAVRIIKKTNFLWVPAIKNGRPVKYRHKQNIVFQVSGQ